MRKSVLESLNLALYSALESNPSVYLLGEDILDPYGGAFKVTKGLSSAFPERVYSTPISEAGIVGIGIGMALRGLRPIVEIMFGDFITLIADQVINHASKFRWMYNDKVRVPLIVRTPMGGRRGYGPTHSQSLEKIFLGIPGLTVVSPNILYEPGSLLSAAIADDDPVIFIEHKLLYPKILLDIKDIKLEDYFVEFSTNTYPATIMHSLNKPAITIATYGYNLDLVLPATTELMMDYEIFCDIVVFSQLSPFDISPLENSLGQTKKLITVEEGTLSLGWGAEVIARAHESYGIYASRRVAAKDLPIGNAKSLEESILPSHKNIVMTALEVQEKR